LIHDVVLEGEKVRLRPFTDDDVPLLHRWFNDLEVLRWLHLSEDPPELIKSLEAHRERWQKMRDDPTQMTWLIETKEGVPIGSVGLLAIHATHSRAELGVSIGEQSFWSRGYGTDAIRTLLRHAFGVMRLRRVQLITDEDNARGIRCYEKCGFVREGLLRSHRLRFGEPLNMVIMGALAEGSKAETAKGGSAMEAKSRGFKIHYLAEGSGVPLVLIHGLMQSSDRWVQWGYVDAFSDHYRVLAVDLLGHGQSDRPHDAEVYEAEGHAADIMAVLNTEGIERAHIWGYSLGGVIAAVFATLYPERVVSLTVGSATVQNLPPVQPVVEWRRSMAEALRRGDWDEYWRKFGLIDAQMRVVLQESSDPLAIAAVIEGDLLPRRLDLSKLNAPILVYAGSAEPTLALWRAGATTCSATFEVIADKDHAGAFQALEIVRPLVEAHLTAGGVA